MVERIVEAGRQVLVEDGYDTFSTNRVAAAADVSPGSLYQYFPDKASIVAVVVDRYVDETSELVAAALSDRITELGPAMVRDTADALLAALERDPALLRVVYEELPLGRTHARLTQVERQVRHLAAAYLGARPEINHRPDAAAAAWIMVLAIENLAVRWVLDRPDLTRDQLLDEMVALIAGYLLS
ncbi:TetR/AcrR family transcriptional regulator [Nocardioides humilatus]|uniref:TetR/AcrR family transcriptional regulator n=2 Tax=Nocardioides humilatus TaxID=2607660 RepID=A0A5B1LHI1_9ACTN|nr:TetR/AcrR family transcriptional regulator [Nocardioides humilatus]